MRYVSYTDRKKLAAAFKPVYTAANADAAQTALLELSESELGRKQRPAIALWERAWDRFIPFLEFPPEIRKIIKNRGHFPTHNAVIKLIWLAICDIEDKRAWAREADRGKPANKRTAKPRLVEGATTHGWKAALGAFDIAFPGRFPATIF
jgi:putative transposase